MPGKNHRIHSKSFSVLKNTQIPTVIIEYGFMSNPDFDKMLQDPSFRIKEAAATFRGILVFCEKHKKEVMEFAETYYDTSKEPSPTVKTSFGRGDK